MSLSLKFKHSPRHCISKWLKVSMAISNPYENIELRSRIFSVTAITRMLSILGKICLEKSFNFSFVKSIPPGLTSLFKWNLSSKLFRKSLLIKVFKSDNE